ncbi:MAG: glycosyltransferase [Mariprofundales bacterium]|nr:glycosyltransferase [Mariprofundales bacterium]
MADPLQRYLQRYPTHAGKTFEKPPKPIAPSTMVVIIPCHDEPTLTTTLESLAQCDPPPNPIEVVVVVNDCANDPESIRQQNQHTLQSLLQYPLRWPLHTINATAQADREGGVGAARKRGMDATIVRMASYGVDDGILISLDADCLVNPHYLCAIGESFRHHPDAPAITTNFAHRIEDAPSIHARAAIINYELHLRLYWEGLKQAGVPYAFPTIGSCFACRASSYAKQGGMNRRQAGEDFYFLHKLAQLGTLVHCTGASVFPSPRLSSRTPFGTGQAMRNWMQQGTEHWPSYHPQSFADLAIFIHNIQYLWQDPTIAHLPDSIQAFLRQQHGEEKINNIRHHTTTATAFHKRCLHWFNGFLAMKFIRFACNTFYGWLPVENSVAAMLKYDQNPSDPEMLLLFLRRLQSQ